MSPLMAYCGLDCASCEARTATLRNDDAMCARVAQQWSELNQVEIRPSDIRCLGCRTEGVKSVYCDSLCPIRQCALSRGVEHCGVCSEMAHCNTLHRLTDNAPQALRNLSDTQ